jgi:hypothetical protein
MHWVKTFWVCVAVIWGVATALQDGIHPLVVDYDEYYYYKSLRSKMAESLSISNCTVDGDVRLGRKTGKADLVVKEVPPSKALVAKWSLDNAARPHRLFAQVSSNLCKATKFSDIVKGHYKRAKGCYKVYVTDSRGIRKKRFNDYGATLHPEHIRCENTLLTGLCNNGQTAMQVVPDFLRKLHEYPFLVTAQKVIVGRGGMFGMPCGPFGLFASCEAVKWGVPAANLTVEHVEHCRDPENECPFPRVGRVFIMTQYDDTQIGQFMQEALPKLVYHLEFLYKNPDVRIHYGFTKQPTVPSFVLPHYFFRHLKLDHRLINGTVYADEVYMPREGGCQDIGYNAWEVVSMRERFLRDLDIHESTKFVVSPPVRQPTVLVLTRSPGPYTQNKADYTTRRWPKDKFPLMLQALRENFPHHAVELFSDQNKTLMTCPLCQAEAFFRADVVVGMHGAGLSNAMFMRPGSVVVEVVHDFDARHAPIIGIFPRLSGVIGLHHYTVFIRDTGLDVVKLANDTAKFTAQAKLWATVEK